MQKQKITSVLKYTMIIFAVIVLYCIIRCFTMTETGLYSLFIGDFSIGYCSRLLIGSILSIFKDSFTKEWMTTFLRIVTFVVFMIAAHYVSSSILHAKKTEKDALMIFTALFIVCPFSVTIYAGDIFGFIDVFCFVVLLITLYFGSNKILIWSLPLFLAAGVFIHDAFITGYMAPCLGVIAYYVIKKHGKKIGASVNFVVSSVVCAATSVYSVIFANSTIKMTEAEMLKYLAKKGNCTLDEVSGYMEGFLFHKDTRDVSMQKEYADNAWDFIAHMLKFATESFIPSYLIYFISIIPIVALVFFVWIKAIKNSNGFIEKVPYILFMLTPVPQIFSLFMSTDFTRFLATIVITQTLYLFMCIKQNDKNIVPAMEFLNNNKYYFVIPCMSTLLVNLY